MSGADRQSEGGTAVAPARRGARALRAVSRVVSVLAVVVAFALSAVFAVVAHLDLPATRRVVAARVTQVLHSELAGDVTIERVDALGLGGLRGGRVRVRDPEGRQVLFVDGISVRLRTLSLLRSVLFGAGPYAIHVDALEIDHADVDVGTDDKRALRLARAFASKSPEPPAPPDPKARGVALHAPRLRLRHAWAHGTPPGAPALDVEIEGLEGRAEIDAAGMRFDVDAVDLVARGLSPRVDPRGRVTAHVSLPAEGERVVKATYAGVVAGAQASAEATLDGPRLDAKLDLRDVTRAGLRDAFGDVPLEVVAGAHAEVHGTLDHLQAKVTATAGQGSVDVEADVRPGDATRVDAKVEARHIDAGAFSKTAPATDVSLTARGHVTFGVGGDVTGDAALETTPSTLDGEPLPGLRATGRFSKEDAYVDAHIDDARAPTHVTATLKTERGAKVVVADVTSRVPSLARLPGVRGAASGSASVRAHGRLDLETRHLEARADVTGHGIAVRGNRIDGVRATATASGPVDAPSIDVTLHTDAARVGRVALAGADARGRVHVGGGGGGITVTGASLDIQKDGRRISASSPHVVVRGSTISVDGAAVTGLGLPVRADLSRDGSGLHLSVDAPSVDLARAAALAGRGGDVSSGTLSVRGEVTLGDAGARGTAHAELRAFSGFGVQGARASLDARAAGRAIDLDVRAELGEAGRVTARTTRLELAGSPLVASSWTGAHGGGRVEGAFDLTRLAAALPAAWVPLSEISGRLSLGGSVVRARGATSPSASIQVYTSNLVVAGRSPSGRSTDGAEAKARPTWRSEGVDVGLDALLDANDDWGTVVLRAWDARGTVASVEAKAHVPYADLAAAPSEAVRVLGASPLAVKVRVPERAFADLPLALQPPGITGRGGAELDVSGSLLEPRATLTARIARLRAPGVPELTGHADAVLTYDGKLAELHVRAGTAAQEALEASAEVRVRTKDLLAGGPVDDLPWTGSARVSLASFPLETFDALAVMQIRGRVSGEATLDDLHADAKLRARVDLAGLRVGTAAYRAGKLVLDAGGGKVSALARLDQADGFAEGRASAGLVWGAAVVPRLDRAVAVDASLDAISLRAAAALPFVRRSLNTLDGRVDANARVHVGPEGRDTRMEGKLVFREGRVAITGLGDELQDVRASVTLRPDGTVRVEDVFARSLSGHITASGTVKTRGLAFESARGEVHVPEKHSMDVSVEGVPVGAVWGDLDISARASERGTRLAVDVDVPRFGLDVPHTPKSGVYDLDAESPTVRVGTYREGGAFVALPLDAADTKKEAPASSPSLRVVDVNVKLKDAVVKYGKMARVELSGNPRVHLRGGAPPAVTGQIVIKRGKVDVQGKKFDVDKGTLTFQEQDATNPVLIATAGWTADDETRIYADFVGPVKTGKVTLRSEPARPRDEILSILLFGTADGPNAAPPPPGKADNGTTKAAASLGGGFATRGLNEALDDLGGVEVTARIDSTRPNNPAPELEIQLTRRVSLAFQHVLGNPPISDPDTNLATIDWRFLKRWSLQTTFGDRGKAQVDAVWQKRY
ncbi:MAG: translocation/assembly module TamB domain-containing protein [Myxococcales bacterium]|nr:translocation/assembly module TamB domain-containing protein [Myxococcales bacterium]